MVGVTASISGTQVNGLNDALKRYGEALGGQTDKATKIAALALCDSLRKNTKKAPKRARPAEYRAMVSPFPPHYITYRRGEKLSKPLHRWQLTRKLGTPDEYTKHHFVYCATKTNKKGKIVKDLAAEKRELKKYHLGISRAGLAKRSWNWIKQDIGGHSGDAGYQMKKNDKRNPRDYVKGAFKAIRDALGVEATARLKNHLDYVEAALKPGALNTSIEAVTKSISWKILQLEAKL